MRNFPGASPPWPPPGLNPGQAGELTASPRPPAALGKRFALMNLAMRTFPRFFFNCTLMSGFEFKGIISTIFQLKQLQWL